MGRDNIFFLHQVTNVTWCSNVNTRDVLLKNKHMNNLFHLIRSSNRWPFASSPRVFVGFLLIFLVFCVVLLSVFTFWVPYCDVRYDFHIKTMFGSSLPLVVCRRAHACLIVYPMLPVFVDCPFLIVPSVLFICLFHIP